MIAPPKNSNKSILLQWGIRQIIDNDMPVDWEWYENAIYDLCDKLNMRLVDGADLDALNAGKVTDGQLFNWVNENVENPLVHY